MRIERAVTITTVPRSTLAHADHKEIDAILKDLRVCARRLKSALDGLKDELRVLERLYYKCKNQHRMALFFKRVPEMRRYGRRLSELDILERVNLLRASFVGLEHANDHKALKGSWSHVPEEKHVHFLVEILSACSTLVCKMQERLEKAYHHFTLAMQSGAFIQLIILFVAISSRMSMLSSQLEEALQLSISTCNRLLVIIHPTSVHTTVFQQLPLEPEILHTIESPGDTGRPDTSMVTTEDLSVKMTATFKMSPPGQPTNTGDHTITQGSKKATAKQKPRQKKAKKRFDEIDEIFGF